MKASLVLSMGLAGCGVSDATTDHVEQHATSCPASFCGGNSPRIRNNRMFDFNLDGQANDAGFRILGMSQGSRAYDLTVRDSRIIGEFQGAPALEGVKVEGARIWLEDDAGQQYAIVISRVGKSEEVVKPWAPLETYVLDWSAVIGMPLAGVIKGGEVIELLPELDEPTPLCPEPPKWDNGEAEWDEASGMSPIESLVFEGDRIDPIKRMTHPFGDDRWFNVGCAAHTLVKMRLTRNTIRTAINWETSQATLKMLSGDYCGTGTAFTVPGEPLVWRDHGTMRYRQTAKNLEARWDENGALCLDDPRLARTSNPAALAAFPDIWLSIKRECGLPPPCGNTDPIAWESSAEWVTSGNYD